ncbi:hypothetical protein C8035_v004379 [Colletotrichum spinosum]|uniref:Uncharacterized protein n=1 Tax=Colletotrichum spinosum TaxID=1347390 RepID=A0A4R8PVK7_9PEZI|nr:hypothetical protein C8035_v004379 [Colletotrichum spinosum]
MVLKRKRSDSELLPVFTSPARSDSSVESFDVPISPSLAFPRAFATPAHLPCRTMKRFRDNRPSEDEIHQRTLKMLYSAQHHHQTLAHDSSPSPAPAPTARSTQKSLHSFWDIKSAAPTPSRTSSPPVDQMMMDSVSCQDCGVGLGPSDHATDGMDIDGYMGSSLADFSCGACGKHVCSCCSVTNLGEQRRCLRCADRRPRAAGKVPAWATPSFGSF